MTENNFTFTTVALAYHFVTREQAARAEDLQQQQVVGGNSVTIEAVFKNAGILNDEQIWAIGKARERLLRDAEANTQKIGNYEILSTVGEGGLGVVYKAKQISIGRIVALKVLHEKWMNDNEFRQRFLVEARLVGRLNHPNLIQIIDVGRHQNQLFYSMEFVEGETVEKMIFRYGRLDIGTALMIVRQTAAALQYLAEKKIVHRDIKPSNIIVTAKGVAKLGDFGFVKSSLESVLSTVGEVLGTPDYISPEAASGERDLDFRSDIYSLGVTFYHMITGQVPFSGSCSAVLDAHIAKELPPLESIDPDMPKKLSAIINKMTAKKPEDRYQLYEELFAHLEKMRLAFSPHTPILGDSEAWRWYKLSRYWRYCALFLAGALLVTIGVALFY